jgi:hypothetical protein
MEMRRRTQVPQKSDLGIYSTVLPEERKREKHGDKTLSQWPGASPNMPVLMV